MHDVRQVQLISVSTDVVFASQLECINFTKFPRWGITL